MTTADAMMPVLILASLFLIRAARPALTNIDLSGYKRLSLGLSLLAGLSLFNLYLRLDLITAAFGHADSFWVEFIGWSGALLGVSLAASGVSSSMPLIRRHRQGLLEQGRNLEFLDRVQKMADNENMPLDNLLARSARDMAATFNVEAYTVFTYSQRETSIALRIVSCSDDATAGKFCALAEFDKAAFLAIVKRDTTSLSEVVQDNRISGVRYPDQMIPIEVQERPVGYYLLWNDRGEGTIETETVSAMCSAAQIVARRTERDHLRLKVESLLGRTGLISRLNKQSGTGRSVTEMLPVLHSELSELTSVDTTVVAVLDLSSRKLNRFSVGRTGSVLLERNLSFPAADTSTLAQGSGNCCVTINNLGRVEGEAEITRKLLTPYLSHGSLSSYCITIDPDTVALVGYYSERTAAFIRQDEELFQSLRSLIGESVLRESAYKGSRKTESDIALLRQLITGLSAVGGSQVELQSTVSFLLRNKNIDAARISLVDDRQFLQSKALACRDARNAVLPAGGIQVLSLMPGHQRAINSGKPILIDQNAGVDFCSPAESAQMLDSSVASALVCPILIEGTCAGTLTLMSEDETGAIFRSVETIEYMTAVSSLIGMSLTWQGQTAKHSAVPQNIREDHRVIPALRESISDANISGFESVAPDIGIVPDSELMTSGYRSIDSQAELFSR